MIIHDNGLPFSDDFARTLAAIEQGLTVSLIATPSPMGFDESYPATSALDEMRANDFTQALVRRGPSAVGILFAHHRHADEQVVRDLATPFEDWMLASSTIGLRTIVTGLAQPNQRFRLVLGAKGIEGIVTRSDLHKLPVRMLLYSLVTHLEFLLASVVQAECDEIRWLGILANAVVSPDEPEWVRNALSGKTGPSVERRLRGQQDRLKKRDIAPDLIDTTEFGHKWLIVDELYGLGPTFRSQMAAIQAYVRNSVMHHRAYAIDDDAIDELVRRMAYIEDWISYFSEQSIGIRDRIGQRSRP